MALYERGVGGSQGIIRFQASARGLLLNHLVRPWDGFASLVHHYQFDDVERHVHRRQADANVVQVSPHCFSRRHTGDSGGLLEVAGLPAGHYDVDHDSVSGLRHVSDRHACGAVYRATTRL
jgi:hypothetical protein